MFTCPYVVTNVTSLREGRKRSHWRRRNHTTPPTVSNVSYLCLPCPGTHDNEDNDNKDNDNEKNYKEDNDNEDNDNEDNNNEDNYNEDNDNEDHDNEDNG